MAASSLESENTVVDDSGKGRVAEEQTYTEAIQEDKTVVDDRSRTNTMLMAEHDEVLSRAISRRPRNFQQFWRGEWKNEHRIPIWHKELHDTRRVVAKQWAKTSMSLCNCI